MWPLASDGQGCSTPRPAPILNVTKICLWDHFPETRKRSAYAFELMVPAVVDVSNLGFAETGRDFCMLETADWVMLGICQNLAPT